MTREMVVKRPRSKPIALPPLILASSGSRRWLFWVSLSLIGLALGHTWTKYAANPENPCSRYVFWSPTVTTVNVSLQLLGAVHKVCHAPGGGGSRKCDSL